MNTKTVTVHSRSFGPFRRVMDAQGKGETRRRDFQGGGVEFKQVGVWTLTLSCGHVTRREFPGCIAMQRPPKRLRCDECPAHIEVLV